MGVVKAIRDWLDSEGFKVQHADPGPDSHSIFVHYRSYVTIGIDDIRLTYLDDRVELNEVVDIHDALTAYDHTPRSTLEIRYANPHLFEVLGRYLRGSDPVL
jgi:hypothetical protein